MQNLTAPDAPATSPQIDSYDQQLALSTEELKNCQKARGLNSCLACSEILECQVRLGYVNAVYESMSKGLVGDFDFN